MHPATVARVMRAPLSTKLSHWNAGRRESSRVQRFLFGLFVLPMFGVPDERVRLGRRVIELSAEQPGTKAWLGPGHNQDNMSCEMAVARCFRRQYLSF